MPSLKDSSPGMLVPLSMEDGVKYRSAILYLPMLTDAGNLKAYQGGCCGFIPSGPSQAWYCCGVGKIFGAQYFNLFLFFVD